MFKIWCPQCQAAKLDVNMMNFIKWTLGTCDMPKSMSSSKLGINDDQNLALILESKGIGLALILKNFIISKKSQSHT